MPASERTRTLLVDADPERRSELERLLTATGYDVTAAADPDTAIRVADVLAPSLVVMAMASEPGVALVGLSGAFGAAPLEPGSRSGRPSFAAGRPTLAELERRYALEILRETRGNKTRAAEILGIDRKTLYRLIDDCRANGEAPAPVPTPPAI